MEDELVVEVIADKILVSAEEAKYLLWKVQSEDCASYLTIGDRE